MKLTSKFEEWLRERNVEQVESIVAVKELEYRDFQRHVSEWERDELMFSV